MLVEFLQWILQQHLLRLQFLQLFLTADSAVAGPGSDPNNANTIGTTFEILFTDEFYWNN